MIRKLWDKCFNYETISYVICGVLTTVVDFVSYSMLRQADVDVALSQALSWAAAVLFAYVVNKLVVFRNFNFTPPYLLREAGSFLAARVFSGVLTWVLMVGLELFCKAVVSAVNLVLNYVASKMWIFKKTDR